MGSRSRLAILVFLLIISSIQGAVLALNEPVGNDVVIVIDSSAGQGESNHWQVYGEAMELFARLLGPRDRLAIIVYGLETQLVKSLTSTVTPEQLLDSTRHLGHFSNLPEALWQANLHLLEHIDSNRHGSILLISDGIVHMPSIADRQLAMLRLQHDVISNIAKVGIPIHVLNVGGETGSPAELLQQLAKQTNGHYAHSPFGSQLISALRAQAIELTQRQPLPIIQESSTGSSYQFVVDDEITELMILLQPNNIEPLITTPAGQIIEFVPEQTPWISFRSGSIFALTNPAAGTWHIQGVRSIEILPFYSSPLQAVSQLYLLDDQIAQLRVWFERQGTSVQEITLYQESSAVLYIDQDNGTELQLAMADRYTPNPFFTANINLINDALRHGLVEVSGDKARAVQFAIAPADDTAFYPRLTNPPATEFASTTSPTTTPTAMPSLFWMVFILMAAATVAMTIGLGISQRHPLIVLEEIHGTERIIVHRGKRDLGDGLTLKTHRIGDQHLLMVESQAVGRVKHRGRDYMMVGLKDGDRVTIDDCEYRTEIKKRQSPLARELDR